MGHVIFFFKFIALGNTVDKIHQMVLTTNDS